MKRVLAVLTVLLFAAAFAVAQESAGQEAQSAGSQAKGAAKSAGKAAKKGADRDVHRSSIEVLPVTIMKRHRLASRIAPNLKRSCGLPSSLRSLVP